MVVLDARWRDRMQNEITLVDRGRGLQISASRMRVHDVVGYFQDGYCHDEIVHGVPSLPNAARNRSSW